MMSFPQIEEIVLEHVELIRIDSNAIAQGKERAGKFLVVEALLANHLKTLEDAKAQVSTLSNANYAQAMMSQNGKNVTENKILAESSPEYSQTRETLEKLDSEINWTKNHMKIFDNAHIMFRQYTRE